MQGAVIEESRQAQEACAKELEAARLALRAREEAASQLDSTLRERLATLERRDNEVNLEAQRISVRSAASFFYSRFVSPFASISVI